MFLRTKRVGRGNSSRFQRICQAPEIGIVRIGIIGGFRRDALFFLTTEFRSQLVGDGFGHLTFDRKDVRQLAIKRIGPEMGIIRRFDQLHVHAHGIAALLHAAFQDVSYAKLPGDLRQVFRRALVMLRRCTRDDFQVSDLR